MGIPEKIFEKSSEQFLEEQYGFSFGYIKFLGKCAQKIIKESLRGDLIFHNTKLAEQTICKYLNQDWKYQKRVSLTSVQRRWIISQMILEMWNRPTFSKNKWKPISWASEVKEKSTFCNTIPKHDLLEEQYGLFSFYLKIITFYFNQLEHYR